jgi:hypothetical protein
MFVDTHASHRRQLQQSDIVGGTLIIFGKYHSFGSNPVIFYFVLIARPSC